MKNSIDYKNIWLSTRAHLESDRYKYSSSGKRSKSRWSLFSKLLNIFVILLKLFNLYKKGLKNAKNIHINKFTLEFPDLPEKFDGYKILHLSDLHLDTLPGIEDIIINKIKNLQYDLCVMTGDYRKNTLGSFMQIINPLKKIVSAKKPKDGIIAIFGNHDTYLMLKQFDKMGIKLLANESISISRGNDKITLTGTDDPFYYYTDQAINALEENINGFKIALVHTSELYETAEQNAYNLYLCGHTHGGQICLPGGIPIITHQFEGKKFYKGQWNFKNMKGYTSQGCGTSGIPIRFYSQSEITLFTLKRKH